MGLKSAGPRATLAYIAPFAVFIAMRWLPVPPELLSPIRLLVVALTIAVFSRQVLPGRPSFPVGSILLGVAVLLIWIAPDSLCPGYRDFWLFRNSLTGAATSSLAPALKSNVFFIVTRVVESAIVIPILEELFWRGWLMRWLISTDFESVPSGRYSAFAFWAVALLFASEHGPYWEVGLIAGVAYNWWAVRTRNLADCMLAHGVTNALLAGFVLLSGRWQYWL